MPGRVFGVAFNHDGSRIAAGSSSDGVGEVRVYNADRRRGRLEGRGSRRRHFHRRFQPRRQHASPPAASTATCGCINAADGKLIKRFTPVEVTGQAVAAK